MRIIGGKLKGKNFYMPKDVRPTQNIIREAIFDIIGQDLTDISFLELFAGSASVALEALSRGAKPVVAVEKDAKCISVIKKNCTLLGSTNNGQILENIEVINTDSFMTIKQMARLKKRFDVIFADPPYEQDLTKKTLKTLMAYDILHPDSLILLEHSKREILPESEGRFLIIQQKKYGSARLTIYKAKDV